MKAAFYLSLLRLKPHMLYDVFMKYYFILGSNPALSLAEIYNYLGSRPFYRLLDKECLLVEDENLPVDNVMNKLGGTIKVGRVVGVAQKNDLLSVVRAACQPVVGRKFFFGFSTFGSVGSVKTLAMQLKKNLQTDGFNARWVISRDKNLSSAAVEQSGLLKNGQEIVLMRDGDKILVGLTIAVQPFKDWSFRDYGRPERDDFSGMLPPKLARIMLNLAKPGPHDLIIDPFCGSGTVLNEAVLLGCQNLLGSDISLEALEASKSNLAWLKSKYVNLDFHCQLYHCDARRLKEILPPASLGRVVTEPYLGPSRQHNNITKTIKELTALYSEFLINIEALLVAEARLVMVWPVFIKESKKIFLQPQFGGLKIVSPLPNDLEIGNVKLTNRRTIIYGRPGQKVWREIVVLTKK